MLTFGFGDPMKRAILLFVLLPFLARAGTYVTGNTTPFVDKVDAKPCVNPDGTKCIVASDINSLKSAAADLRTHTTGSFNVRDYGAIPDDSGDDAAAIQSAINAAKVKHGVVFFPEGTYRVSAPLVLDENSVALRGAGYTGATIQATAGMDAVIKWSDSMNQSSHEISNLKIYAAGLASYGIYSATISHFLLHRVQVMNATLAGVSLGYGWDNDIVESAISYNGGDGVRLTIHDNNAVNILNSKIYNNSGFGIVAYQGTINVIGSTLENNAAGAIYQVNGGRPLNVTNCYFEVNGQNGYTFASPSITVKANILLNASTDPTVLHDWGDQWDIVNYALNLTGSKFIGTYTDSIVFASGSQQVNIWGNSLDSGKPAVLFPAPRIDTSSALPGLREVTIWGNFGMQTVAESGTLSATAPVDTSGWDIRHGWGYYPRRNWMSPKASAYSSIASGGGGTFSVSAGWSGWNQYQITKGGGGDSDTFGETIDLSVNTDLKGQLVYLAGQVWTNDTSSDVAFYNSVTGADRSTPTAGTVSPQWRATTFRMPTSGTVTVGFRLIGGTGTSATLYQPVLAIVGSPYADLTRDAPAAPESARTTTIGWDPGTVNPASCAAESITIAGAATGSECLATSSTLNSTLLADCHVTGTNTVSLRVCNAGGTGQAGSAYYSVRIFTP